MRILFVINQLTYGGAERQLMYLVKDLEAQGCHVDLCSLTPGGDLHPAFAASGVNTIFLRKVLPRMDLTRAIRLATLIKRLGPDIVHAFMFTANLYTAMAKVLLPFPLIVSERNAEPQKPLIQRFLEPFVFGRADCVICNSVAGAKLLEQRGLGKRNELVVVPNGIDTSRFANLPSPEAVRRSLGLDGRVALVGIFGTLDGIRKDHATFLHAFKALQNCGDSPIRGLCVGGGSQFSATRDLARRLGLEDRVIFTGSRSDVPELMAATDVVVSSSRWEGMPNVIMEAMAAEKPVVATAVGGTPELVVDGKTGFLVEPGDADSMAGRIAELLADPELAARMGRAGKIRIETDFTIDSMVSRTAAVYEKVLQRENAAPHPSWRMQ